MLLPHLSQAVELLCAVAANALEDDENKAHVIAAVGELFAALDVSVSSHSHNNVFPQIQQNLVSLADQLTKYLGYLWLSCDCSSPVRKDLLSVRTAISRIYVFYFLLNSHVILCRLPLVL
jgi:hypothetical protein